MRRAHHPRVARRLRDHVGQDLVIDPEALGDAKGLAHRHGRHARDEVVAELRDLPGTDGPNVNEVRAHRRERGPRFLDVRRVAPDHDRERSVRRARHAPGHRRVDEAHAFPPQRLRHATRHPGIDRRHVDAELPGRGTLQHAALAEVHALDVRRRRQHRHDEVGTACSLSRRARRLRARFHRGVERGRHDVVRGDGEALGHEVGEHGPPHGPGADERDRHDEILPAALSRRPRAVTVEHIWRPRAVKVEHN